MTYSTQIIDFDDENVFIPLPEELLSELGMEEGDSVTLSFDSSQNKND
ncbi:hypothetical protein [Idiomarina abyssalis]